MAKSLQAKYFSDGDLFNLKKKTNTTWSWRSLSSKLAFLQANSCWRLGNGKKILIWKNRWILGLSNPPIPKLGCTSHQKYKFVHGMFHQNSGSWDIHILQELFEANKVNLIMGLHIHNRCEDRLIWLLEKNDSFSVKSAYRKMYEEQDNSELVGPRMIKIYKSLWKMPLLPRIRQFPWKVVSSLLPIRDILSSKIPGIASVRPFCELTGHEAGSMTFMLRELQLMTSAEEPSLRVAYGMTDVTKLFRTLTLERTILKARSFISEHLTQNNMQHATNNRVCCRNICWLPPPVDVVTINIDGSYLNSNNTGGIGLMVRNFAGEQQVAECIYLTGIRNAEQAECMGLWETVNLAQRLKLENVHFELDAKTMVEAVNNKASID
ncbi:uncharacterized protein LOC113324757 [Papaver somniferum]|uniref:uncharacterized protein LOC113324757 n=1 Tax=Papaver somniferum TaxID=3469 RepID=UPI000E6FA709|nr:uncharacterized protein LOC113324757 [Papaver somniferum]